MEMGFSRAPRKNHRAGFGHVARPMRPINREGDMLAFLQPLCHHRESFDRST